MGKKKKNKQESEETWDLTGLADWRVEVFGKVAHDVPARYPGGPAHKAGSFIYFSPTLVRHPTYNAIGFITPSPMAMALNIASSAASAALTLRTLIEFKNSVSPLGTVKTVTEETIPHLFDYFERCMVAVTFSFQALEAFSNQAIQASVKGTYQVQRKSGPKDLSADELEREVATEEKLSTILPNLFSVKSPKGTKVWERFIKLKRVRDSTIHLKKWDAQSTLDMESLYFQFLNHNAREFPKAALSMIEHFRPTKGGPLWMGRIHDLVNKR